MEVLWISGLRSSKIIFPSYFYVFSIVWDFRDELTYVSVCDNSHDYIKDLELEWFALNANMKVKIMKLMKTVYHTWKTISWLMINC